MKNALFLFIGSMVCLTSCTGTVRESLAYHPVITQQKKNNISLKVEDFEDTRTQGQHIGTIKNLYGVPLYRITTEHNISNWVTDAIRLELANAGYSIVDSTDGYQVEGEINKVYTKGRFGINSYMVLSISLNKNGTTIFQKVYETKRDSSIECSDGNRNWVEYATHSEILKKNLQDVCTRFIADVNEHLLHSSKRAPENTAS
jgi:hypothetical protein